MRNKPEIIIAPSKWERFRLRVMILAGVLVMLLFLNEVFKGTAEYPILFYMLAVTIVYSCSRLIHEWIHYFYITVPPTISTNRIFSVDIFTTFCKGEPYEMIEETLLAIVNITYPHQSYLCDESDDPYLKALCEKLGVNHVTRIKKVDAKAGNINNALLISSGELCVVLDPDHVPQPNFLDPIVAHFNDEKIGYVQIVQAYKNYGESLIAKGAAQQTFQFYGPIMMTMNKYGTVLAIGANCTFRRAALESIGGHAAGLAEDMNTAMHLHAKGWKSIYVPQILARGLVPSTMSAYYAQQLKWARGVFELLVTSYPKLFKKFTWQQKIHYALIPLYYLSGIIFLINFLIPILSLTFDTSPINIDFLYFMMYAGPLVLLSFLIRLFVQRWVMEEEERGFHVVGGLLMIGTWWIFLIGLYYTILRKKIPYIPTPKDGKEDGNWKINIPNIAVIIISILSIIYGLVTDWNPYNLIMSGFASVNCLILSFSIVASRQAYFRSLKKKYSLLNTTILGLVVFKKRFWLLRRFLYKQVRRFALLIAIIISGFMFVWSIKYKIGTDKILVENYNKNILISGIFEPYNSNGLSSVSNVINIEKQNDINFGIVSLYLSWGDAEKCKFPTNLVDSIYKKEAIPMITWEPWQSLFTNSKDFKPEDVEKQIFKRIIEHRYDKYLEDFSKQLKRINKPIYIRFAHETDNPQYPWSSKGQNSPEEFKQAWQYIHNFFSQRNLNNVIWVWNPWKPNAVSNYFPGRAFVDWIGVTNLNYGVENKAWQSMEQLYKPFHQNPIFRMGLPIMLAEMGSLKKQNEWFKEASKTINNKFPEIKAFILFNSGIDKNLPIGFAGQALDWRVHSYSSLKGLINSENKRNIWLESNQNLILNSKISKKLSQKNLSFLNEIRGTNYRKSQNWSSNGLVLKKKIIVKDMTEIEKVGFNTVKIYGLSIYDDNILEVANDKNLNVVYGFWLPDNISFLTDSSEMNKYSEKILSNIKKNINRTNIKMWNIANNPLKSLRYRNFKPDLLSEQNAYLIWLNKLIKEINEVDGVRPISVDIYIDENFDADYKLLNTAVPNIDCIGLVENRNPEIRPTNILRGTFMSTITPKSYLANKSLTAGIFLSQWQDEKTTNFVSLNGLKDNTGKYKLESYQISNKWRGLNQQIKIPKIKILLPANTMWPNAEVTFHAMYFSNKQWKLTNNLTSFKFRWELIKYDQFENPIQVKDIGTGNQVDLIVPENVSRYKIRLYMSNDTVVNIAQSKLNIPLKSTF
ncbi:glycosyltransferase family 2 protein [Pedobacter sp.]|uniref:glycosyltransferase family 2 protein n=1 Tax=Pedobacter sp. TaxID=1411316 RepID=UPI003BAD31AF